MINESFKKNGTFFTLRPRSNMEVIFHFHEKYSIFEFQKR
jgi:hypothetical protein